MKLDEFSNDTQLNELLGALGKAAGMAARGAVAIGKGAATTTQRLARSSGTASDLDSLRGMERTDGKPMDPQKAAQVAAQAAKDQQDALRKQKDDVQQRIKDAEEETRELRKQLQDIQKASIR